MSIASYLNAESAPKEPPRLADMGETTRMLHLGIDRHIKATGVPYLHPTDPTVQLDLLGSKNMLAWQERKAQCVWLGEQSWSRLPQTYARYGTEITRQLLGKVIGLEHAKAGILTDCGMQACALLFDVLVKTPQTHAVIMRQVYNKTRKYLERLIDLVGGSLTIVDDGDYAALEKALHPTTKMVFAETFTNPLMRAVDPSRLGAMIAKARAGQSPDVRLVVDNTIATPWALNTPLLDFPGMDFVVASGTKALGGQDRDLWGYIASNHIEAINEIMDLQAMRGGIIDWRRTQVVLEGLSLAQANYAKRCASALRVVEFLQKHPQVLEVFHPSVPLHPDRTAIDRHYKLLGSMVSFRLRRGLDSATEDATRHFCDVLCMTQVPRYALSFDGLATKVNHHKTVSEYFTPEAELKRAGFDRLVRLGIGLEDSADLVACLNWALWHYESVSVDDVRAWQTRREQS